MFAGDLGAGKWASDVAYDHYGNISLIASGMGEGIGDNFVVANVHQDKSVTFDLICLNEPDMNCLGKLTDYNLTTDIEEPNSSGAVKVYPTLVKNYLTIESSTNSIWQADIFDLKGQHLHHSEHAPNSKAQIYLKSLPTGMYYVRINSETSIETRKFIIE